MQTVLFDPGYSDCILGVSDNVEFMYSAFVQSSMPLKQKKFQFSILFPKLKKCSLKTFLLFGVSFVGGLSEKLKNAVFENNPCLNTEFDEKTAYDETNF